MQPKEQAAEEEEKDLSSFKLLIKPGANKNVNAEKNKI